jgi:lipid II:glycine glycyltransferase (peptidoglycan interpeptide bridge formation enzyme)
VENSEYIRGITEAGLDICEKSDSFLQSAMWGKFKARHGWKSGAYLVDWAGYEKLPLLALSRELFPGFTFAYIPWGPELPCGFPRNEKPFVLRELALKLKPFLARNAALIRFEPPWFAEDAEFALRNEDAAFLSSGFKRSAAVVQPPDTALVSLELSHEEILAAMKPKWRYNISLSEKKGVTVEDADVQGLEIFYRLMRETAARDGIALRGIDYYKTLFDVCEKYPGKNGRSPLRLYTAYHEEDALAAIAVLFWGKNATYLYGASSNIKRNLMAAYALQWKAMKDAKDAGCKQYDLFGMPPDGDPNHPMAGLYRFKTGFGGKIIHRPGTWDYPLKPAAYFFFSKAEALRKKLRDLKKKLIRDAPRLKRG